MINIIIAFLIIAAAIKAMVSWIKTKAYINKCNEAKEKVSLEEKIVIKVLPRKIEKPKRYKNKNSYYRSNSKAVKGASRKRNILEVYSEIEKEYLELKRIYPEKIKK